MKFILTNSDLYSHIDNYTDGVNKFKTYYFLTYLSDSYSRIPSLNLDIPHNGLYFSKVNKYAIYKCTYKWNPSDKYMIQYKKIIIEDYITNISNYITN